MADKQIRDLTELTSGNIVPNDWLEIQEDDKTVSKKVTVTVLNEIEAKAREIRDDAIEAGVGLDTDGTYIAPVGTNFLTASTDVMVALVALDTALGGIGGVNIVYEQMNAAAVQNLDASPIEIVAASGAGTYIEIISAFAHNEYTSDPFTIPVAGKLTVQFDGGATHLLEWTESFVESTATVTERGAWTSNVEILVNTKLEITTTETVIPDGNDDGVITVFLAYIIRTIP